MNFDLGDDQLALRDGIRAVLDSHVPMERVRRGWDDALRADLAAAGVFDLLRDGFRAIDAAVVFEELGAALVPGPLVWLTLAGEAGADRPRRYPAVLPAEQVLLLLGAGAVERVRVVGEPVDRPLDVLTPVVRVERAEQIEPLELVGDAARAAALLRQGAVLTAAFAVGVARACGERSAAYALEREQFGRPIGAFQAVKHLCADMVVRTEVARAAVYEAAVRLDEPDEPATPRAVHVAKLLAGEAAIANGRAATQVHGGMGYTWEVDVHLYLKRAWVLDTQFGSVDEHADALAALLV